MSGGNNHKKLHEVPEIYCALSVSYNSETSANKFAGEVSSIARGTPKIFSPKLGSSWIVEVAVVENERFWVLNEALAKLFAQIQTEKAQINSLIKKYGGDVTIDIAVYESQTYPAIFLSQEIVSEICFFNAQIGIDLL